jgi:rhodanese-related sulfurtransferase
MHIPVALIKVFLTLTMSLVFSTVAFGADDAPRIESEQLRAKLDQPGVYLLDVRIVSDWKKSDRKIPGAVRVDPHDVSSWAGKYPKDELLVVYCA